jgi:hypothetical protein
VLNALTNGQKLYIGVEIPLKWPKELSEGVFKKVNLVEISLVVVKVTISAQYLTTLITTRGV